MHLYAIGILIIHKGGNGNNYTDKNDDTEKNNDNGRDHLKQNHLINKGNNDDNATYTYACTNTHTLKTLQILTREEPTAA